MRNMSKMIVTATLICAFTWVSESAMAREKALLKQALANSTEERAGVEKEFKSNDVWQRRLESQSPNAIHVEIGDELAAEGSDIGNREKDNQFYRERGVAKQLNNEWKEVNSIFKTQRGENRQGAKN